MTIEELRLNNWMDDSGNYWNPPGSDQFVIYDKSDVRSGKYKVLIPNWFVNSDKDIWITKNVNLFLESKGRSSLEWYCRFILNLPEVPKCSNINCNNRVILAEGKLSHGIYSHCSKSCGQSTSNRVRWKNSDDYFNSQTYKKIKSEEMTNNLKVWNKDPKFQADCKRGKILKKTWHNYEFYLAIDSANNLKFGVMAEGTVDWRLYVQEFYNENPYKTIHTLFKSDNETMANIEYEIKEEFGFREYLSWSEFPKLKAAIKFFTNRCKDRIYR